MSSGPKTFTGIQKTSSTCMHPSVLSIFHLQASESRFHRIIRVGEDLHDHLVQPFISTQPGWLGCKCFPSSPQPSSLSPCFVPEQAQLKPLERFPESSITLGAGFWGWWGGAQRLAPQGKLSGANATLPEHCFGFSLLIMTLLIEI